MGMLHKKTSHERERGFALVELIVALGIFTSVMVIAGTSFFVIMNANREVRAQQISFDNLNFALDSMLRSLRTGSAYDFSQTSGTNVCDNSGTLEYANQDGVNIEYRCQNGSLERRENSANWIKVTAAEITINDLYWYYDTSAQPLITMVIAGYVEEGSGSRADFSLQTTISQRTIGN